MVNLAAPKPVRFLVMLSAAFLLVSIVISGVNAYVALASPAQAPYVSDKVGFEGQLTDSAGLPVADGTYSITFGLYSTASGGTALWTETQNVSVVKGLYSVQLGANTSLPSTAFDAARWLGVKVGTDSEMTPRIAISAVPFALNARQAQGLQGYNVSSNSPASNNSLYWNSTSSQWEPRAGTVSDLAAVGSNASPQTFLSSFRQGASLSYIDTSNFKVSAGQVMVNGLMRSNSSDSTVGLAGSLDAGSLTTNTTYYVYAVADSSGPGFTITSSTNSTQPTGKTNFRKIGWVKTAQDSSNIATISTNGFNSGGGTIAAIIKPRATVTNTTAETTIYTVTIPAGTLSNGNQVNLRFFYTFLNGGSSRDLTWRVKLGSATDVASFTTNVSGANGGGTSIIDVVVFGTGTNAQTFGFSGGTWGGVGAAIGGIMGTDTASATENSSNALTLTVTAQINVAATTTTLDVTGGTLLAPYWP